MSMRVALRQIPTRIALYMTLRVSTQLDTKSISPGPGGCANPIFSPRYDNTDRTVPSCSPPASSHAHLRRCCRWRRRWSRRDQSVCVCPFRRRFPASCSSLRTWWLNFDSSYLLKPHDAAWEDGIIALDAGTLHVFSPFALGLPLAGSGQGALAQILRRNPLLFRSHDGSKTYTAFEIYSFLQYVRSYVPKCTIHTDVGPRCFLITHAHLDHISGLVMSAGSLSGPRKRIYATKETLDDLTTIFSDRIWPNLASWSEIDEDYKLLYSLYASPLFCPFPADAMSPHRLLADNKYKSITPAISVRTIPISHGHNDMGHYGSAAFFLRHDQSTHEFLFFGDVEPDAVAMHPQTLNVWRAAAPMIPQTLSAIFIECSWPAGRSDATLYGHLSPTHLVDELVALAGEVVKCRRGGQGAAGVRVRPVRKKQRRNPIAPSELVGALDGLRVYVMHCKDDFSGDPAIPMRDIIVPQVRALVEEKKLGAEIIAVEQGMCIGASLPHASHSLVLTPPFVPRDMKCTFTICILPELCTVDTTFPGPMLYISTTVALAFHHSLDRLISNYYDTPKYINHIAKPLSEDDASRFKLHDV